MRLTTYSVATTILMAAGIFTFWPGRNAGPGAAMLVAQAPAAPAATPKAVDPFAVPKAAKAEPSERSLDDAAQRLRFELEKPTTMEFVEQPLKDVVLYLAENHSVPIYLRAKRLEEASISPDHPITLNFKGVRLRTALEIMLSDLELTFVEKDGILIITTPEEAQNTLVIQVYNCRDLLAEDLGKAGAKKAGVPIVPAAGEVGAASPGGFGSGFGGGGSGLVGMSPTGEASPNPAVQDHRAQQLMNLLTTNVDQQSWLQSGGPGSISEYSGLIVVTQSAETHRKVERTLDMLREAAGLEIPKVGKVVR